MTASAATEQPDRRYYRSARRSVGAHPRLLRALGTLEFPCHPAPRYLRQLRRRLCGPAVLPDQQDQIGRIRLLPERRNGLQTEPVPGTTTTGYTPARNRTAPPTPRMFRNSPGATGTTSTKDRRVACAREFSTLISNATSGRASGPRRRAPTTCSGRPSATTCRRPPPSIQRAPKPGALFALLRSFRRTDHHSERPVHSTGGAPCQSPSSACIT